MTDPLRRDSVHGRHLAESDAPVFRSPRSVPTWHFRQQGCRAASFEASGGARDHGRIDERACRLVFAAKAVESVRRLSEEHDRRIWVAFVLRFRDGLAEEFVADRLDVSVRTVGRLLSRADRELRRACLDLGLVGET